MIEQLFYGNDPTQARKACWGCYEVPVPYNLGFCEVCWEKIPEPVQRLYDNIHRAPTDSPAINFPEPYCTRIRVAIVEAMQVASRPPRVPSRSAEHHTKQKRKPRLTLTDLGL